MRNFALGSLVTIPSGANPTPVQFGWLKDLAVDIKDEMKYANGQYRYATDAGRGRGEITIKAKLQELRTDILLAATQGATSATGSIIGITGEAATIPGSPFQVTVANGATFSEDCGVLDLTSAKYLTRVASAPATGQYSVNTATGLYTFAAADTTHNLQISYLYT